MPENNDKKPSQIDGVIIIDGDNHDYGYKNDRPGDDGTLRSV